MSHQRASKKIPVDEHTKESHIIVMVLFQYDLI